MKVLVLCGGTGATDLQSGLRELLWPNIEVVTLINQYDNGKSTGAVRQVFDGDILGPSDLRKNQLLWFKLLRHDSKLATILDERFDVPAHEVEEYCLNALNKAPFSVGDKLTLTNAVKFYFDNPNALLIDYKDFSISNIIYAALAAQNNNSMTEAATIMAGILGIPDNVINNSDESLFLRAEIEDGNVIFDEGDIVDWNSDIRIKRIFFADKTGKETGFPVLSDRAKAEIADADVIIFSSGTQWSSLIPTYVSRGFYDAVKKSKAKKYLVMNNVPDKDMIGVSSADIFDLLKTEKFLPVEDITFILNGEADPLMQQTCDGMTYILEDLRRGNADKKKHNGRALVSCIFRDYYKDYLDADAFVFDYDDTLVNRGESGLEWESTSKLNLDSIRRILSTKKLDSKFIVCSGNTIKSLVPIHPKVDVYADGGIIKYETKYTGNDPSYEDWGSIDPNDLEFVNFGSIDKSLLFTQKEVDDIIATLIQHGIHSIKISNRSFSMIAIKPIADEYRVPLKHLIEFALDKNPSVPDCKVRVSGRTTLEITKASMDKAITLTKLTEVYDKIVYIGDEFHDNGNDAPVKLIEGVKCLAVKNAKDTRVFLKILTVITDLM